MVSVGNDSILKKISAVIVMMTALVFFSFYVFADTPVQPLQVVTYSDTTTNIRISGTAERLHYNVDSFQVVFMNPPNNYGTACTPVLISFRFYNASDIPAYVGQPEFEITATTGTGAVNTIIYGYDQISTDLFVAESSYSTAEVGRIGIGASNDFAYYTGFVIPPRTSLYFSCIVYVNASAYGQNNTGATEDVNQVTLSSLNLYTNQLSFSADYPYHNQPVDFDPIINAINDLADTVSTSSEMQQLISALTYEGNIYQYTPSNYNNQSYWTSGGFASGYVVECVRYTGKSYLTTVDTEYVNDTYATNGAVRYPFTIYIRQHNQNNFVLRTNYFNRIQNFFPSINGIGGNIVYTYFYSDLYKTCTPNYWNNNTGLICWNKFNGVISGANQAYGYIPSGVNITYIVGYIQVPVGTDLTWPNFNSVDSFTDWNAYNAGDVYLPKDEYTIIKDLYLAYSQVNGLDDSSDISNDVADVSDSNHIIEESYYSANASAIEATGLSNYRFSNDQNNGIGKVADDFMLLWNSLGSWNGVYVFSLTMALATFIMRHRGMLPSRSKDDKGGEE